MQRDENGAFAAGAVTLAGRLTVTSTNGLVATGTYGSGAIPAEGVGSRMMWYPRRAAFRAGIIESGAPLGGIEWNDANIGDGSVAMGTNTVASGQQSVALGINSRATAQAAFSIGFGNVASGLGSFALGFGTTASGEGSTATGFNTTASGAGSTALGYAASAGFDGSFVYGDASTRFTNQATVTASAANQFVVRAAGGTTFYSNADLSAGVSLAAGGGAWETVSDRNRKTNFRSLNGEDILAKLRHIAVSEWSYRSEDTRIRHIGPMAQDFYGAFGLGTSDLTITTSDISGVNMMAIKALLERTDRLAEDNVTLRSENATLRSELDAMQDRIARLEALLAKP